MVAAGLAKGDGVSANMLTCGVALLVLGTGSGQVAAQADMDEALREIRQQASAIEAQARSAPRPPWLEQARGVSESMVQGLEPIAEQAARITECAVEGSVCDASAHIAVDAGPVADPLHQVTFTLYVSRSLGEGQLRELFAFASAEPDTRILFRGVAEAESLIDFVASLQPLLAELEPPPTVLLDPTPFVRDAIHAVPTLVAHGPDGSELARVSGLATTGWLRRALAEGERGDLGVRGPVRAIAEPDLLEEIHRRLARIDFAALGEHALERAFERLRFESLPSAGEDRTRLIDPTLTAGADIRLPDGTLLVRAGESVNPLDRLPFTQRLVVFDAADRRQLAFVRELAGQGSEKPSVYLLTGLPRKDGWRELQRVSEALDSPVYLLTPELRRRFALERVPAVVEAKGRQFRITETAMSGVAVAEAEVGGAP
ncbi:conjugal transfer protein [Thiohalocapsa marina]|uniref:Conjugal transfer protein n=1 Tax=Thiohalocapsa marina TaxID=424902 RepID=A0A5M8FVW2_9GAMM|nr:conjugal transfer protein [Thiohalocapsa marina]